MGAETVFDKLATGISREERRALLQRLGERGEVSDAPLAEGEAEEVPLDAEAAFARLGLVVRFFLFLKMLFTRRSKSEVIEEYALLALARGIERKSTGLIDCSEGLLLPAFCVEVKNLKDALLPFAGPVREIMGQEKAGFIAFLAELHMEEALSCLVRETDPAFCAMKARGKEAPPGDGDVGEAGNTGEIPPAAELSNGEIKRMMDAARENCMRNLPPEGKALMYKDMKALEQLALAAQYHFDRLITLFPVGPDGTPLPCSIIKAREAVLKLAESLSGMKDAPSAVLLRAVFLFYSGEKASDPGAEDRLAGEIKSASRALEDIRGINRRTPWLAIARYVASDSRYDFSSSGGAEDWFALFKLFWKSRTDEVYKDFCSCRRQKEMDTEIRWIFGSTPVEAVENYVITVEGREASGPFVMSLGVAKTFLQVVLTGDVGRVIDTILSEGIFYKGENRTELAAALETLGKAGSILEKFEASLAPGGNLAAALNRELAEKVPPAAKRLSLEAVLARTNMDVEYFIKTLREGLKLLTNILGGILTGDVDGHYDSLSNLNSLGGKENETVRKDIGEALVKCKQVGEVLDKLFAEEKGL
ncbi:MAG: DUF5312 domain-containing protein [Spirochaetales bacterium]|jgi:hypothetical protein|nr:DUF5312 domain-containing protein [Spirochaetales bacterium]